MQQGFGRPAAARRQLHPPYLHTAPRHALCSFASPTSHPLPPLPKTSPGNLKDLPDQGSVQPNAAACCSLCQAHRSKGCQSWSYTKDKRCWLKNKAKANEMRPVKGVMSGVALV